MTTWFLFWDLVFQLLRDAQSFLRGMSELGRLVWKKR